MRGQRLRAVSRREESQAGSSLVLRANAHDSTSRFACRECKTGYELSEAASGYNMLTIGVTSDSKLLPCICLVMLPCFSPVVHVYTSN